MRTPLRWGGWGLLWAWLAACPDPSLVGSRAVLGPTPEAFDFGEVVVGVRQARTLTLENGGGARITVRAIRLEGEGAFSVDRSELTVPGHGRVDLEVRAVPVRVGTSTGRLVLVNDSENAPEVAVALSVRAVPVPDCDDGRVCTADRFDFDAAACAHDALEGPCDDGSVCTSGDRCVDGACLGQLMRCDDGNECTRDACDDRTGCVSWEDPSACDDGNPCTLDRCEEKRCSHPHLPTGTVCRPDGAPCVEASVCLLGRCTDLPIPDGSPCDDGDLCTEGDACHDGACTGRATTEAPQVRGRTFAFGSPEGFALPLSDGRVVFVDPGPLVTVAEVAGDTLTPLRTTALGGVGAVQGLVEIAPGRLAALTYTGQAEPAAGLRILEIGPDGGLTTRGRVDLGLAPWPDGGRALGFGENTVYACLGGGGTGIGVVSVEDPDDPWVREVRPAPCTDLAADPTSHRVFVLERGVHLAWYDLWVGGGLGQYHDTDLNGTALAARDGVLALGHLSDLRVVDAKTLVRTARRICPEAVEGLDFMDDALAVLGCLTPVIEDTWVLGRYDAGSLGVLGQAMAVLQDPFVQTRARARGALAAVGSTVFAFPADAGDPTRLDHPARGPVRALVPDPNGLVSLAPERVARLDLGDLDAPRFTSSLPSSGPRPSTRAALFLGPFGVGVLAGGLPPTAWPTDPAAANRMGLELVDALDLDRPVSLGLVQAGTATVAAGTLLLGARLEDGPRVALEIQDARALAQGQAATLGTLEVDCPPAAGREGRIDALAIRPDGARAAVAFGAARGDPDEVPRCLVLLDLAEPAAPRVLARMELAHPARSLALAGGEVAILEALAGTWLLPGFDPGEAGAPTARLSVALLRGGTDLSVAEAFTTDLDRAHAILWFDGRVALLSAGVVLHPGPDGWPHDGYRDGPGRLVVLDLRGVPPRRVDLPLPQAPLTATPWRDRLYLGSRTAVSVVRPVCPAP